MNGWTNYETWVVATHILNEDVETAQKFVDAACDTTALLFLKDVQDLAHTTWDGVAWFVEVHASVNWQEIAETLRYV